MKKQLIIFICFLVTLCVSPVLAGDAGPDTVSGMVSLGLRSVDVEDGDGEAKFNEYRDKQSGAFGDIFLNYDSDRYSLSLKGENIGLDNQYYRITGRKWGLIKYSVYYNETPHNFTYDARTFYANPGSDNLVYGGLTVPADVTLWQKFDYAIKRKDLGGDIELRTKSPFYFYLSANHLQREGTYPIGAPSGVFRTVSPGGSPFGNMTEMPLPIDNSTKNASLEVGYRTKELFLSLTGSLSSYENDKEWLTFKNPFATSQAVSEIISLPADNKARMLKFSGLVRLPMDTTLSLNAGYSKLTSEISLLDTIWSSTNAPSYSFITLGLNDPRFDGELTYKKASLLLASSPVKNLNLKAYYKYLDKDNDSDHITYTNGTLTASNHLFEYKKNNAGLEVAYKVLKNLKASAGYDYLNVERERHDIPETTDNTFFVKVKYSPIDMISARLKYQRLNRDGDHEAPGPDLIARNAAYAIENFLSRFDAASKKQDSVKASIDITPIEALDVTLEYAYKRDNYDDTILGMKNRKRNEFIVDVAYDAKFAKVYGFFDYEEIKTEQTARAIGSNVTDTASYNPNQAPTASNYNWDVDLKEQNYIYGVGVDIPLMSDKLAIGFQYSYEKSNGDADFTSQTLAGTQTQDTIDAGKYDDYTQRTFSAKVRYNLNKNLKFILGYLYEKYAYSDVEFDGYRNIITSGGNPNTYLTGAYNDESYKANVVYLKAIYKF